MATDRSTQRPLAPLHESLANSPEVDLAVLFGSVARGEEGGRRRDSDVDVGLLLAPGSDDDTRRRVRRRLQAAVGSRLDIVFLAEAPPLLRFEIARDGEVLLERRPHAWSDFKMRAMIDWWDWAPYARILQEAAVRRLRQSLTDGAS